MNPSTPFARIRTPLLVALISLLFGLAVLAVLLFQAERLVRLGLIGNLWYVLLLLTGLAAAVALFALFKSYARYSGKVLSGTLELGGPAVLMLAVVLLGFWLVPMPVAAFDVTVFVHGAAGVGAQVLRDRGTVSLFIGNDQRQERIGAKGEARFIGIPASFRGRRVPVAVLAEDYELAEPQAQVLLDPEAVYLKVKPKDLPLSGRVFDAETQQAIPGARLTLADQDGLSDANGCFQFTLPADKAEQALRITVPGYAPWSGRVTAGGNALSVPLSRAPH